MMDLARLDPLASTQLGLVTLAQVLEIGGSVATVRRATKAGRLVPVRRRVFRLPGSPATQEQAWLAAVLSADAEVVVSHVSAAALWGFRGFSPPQRVDLLTTGKAPRLPRVNGHTTSWLPNEDRTTLRNVPVTSAARTIIDASRGIDPWILGRIVDDGLRRKLLTLGELRRCFDAVPPSGQRPSAAMREVLSKRGVRFDPGGSAAELDVLRVLRSASIEPLPVQQAHLVIEGRTFRPDYLWPASKQILEYDGAGGHSSESARHDDRERWRALQRAGFTIWPVTERTTEAEIVAIGRLATQSAAS